MLREVRGVAQRPGEDRRRWFNDMRHDLYTWQRDGAIVAFEFTVETDACTAAAVRWTRAEGLTCYRVDDGEHEAGRYKMAPVMQASGCVDLDQLAAEFGAVSAGIDRSVVSFVTSALRGRSRRQARPPASRDGR